MNIVLKIILLLLGVLGFIALSLWVYGKYWFATKQSYREIAKGLSIGPHWLEIVPQPPLKIQKRFQKLLLITEGYGQRLIDTTPRQVRLSDGTLIDPKIEIVDQNGEVHTLESFGLMNSNIAYESHFTREQLLTRVRIRCDTPFSCSKVIWTCYKLK